MTLHAHLRDAVQWLDAIALPALEAGAVEAGIREPYSVLAAMRQALREDDERQDPPQQRHEYDEQQAVA